MKKINLVFIIVFMLIITLPYLFAHRDVDGRISNMENRVLAAYPLLMEEDGGINKAYSSQFEEWIGDNFRGRTSLMELNASLQYRLFQNIVKTDVLQGEDGWLFTNSQDQIEEYQHSNLMSESQMETFGMQLQNLSDYLQKKGIAFYYFQCYSKEAIYPEKYNKYILQTGEKSRTEQIMTLLETMDIRLIDSKNIMLEHKADDLIYFQYVDTIHWNEEGAYWGYQELMNEIHKDFGDIPVLKKENYEIYEEERSTSIYGFEYPYTENTPVYQLKNPQAVEISENDWEWLHYKEHTHEYSNKTIGNHAKILLVGDSYIRMFLKDDIAESFEETLSVDWLNIPILDEIVEIYQPDIVVLECVDSKLGSIAELTNQMDFIEK